MGIRKYVKIVKMLSRREACAVRVFDGAGQGAQIAWCKDGVFHRVGTPLAALMPLPMREDVSFEGRRTIVGAIRDLRERGRGIRLP